MPYEGPGRYQHFKGTLYEVVGLALQEDTVRKPGQPEHDGAGPEVQFVIYRPLTAGSLLERRQEDLWARRREDFDATIGKALPRFERVDR